MSEKIDSSVDVGSDTQKAIIAFVIVIWRDIL